MTDYATPILGAAFSVLGVLAWGWLRASPDEATAARDRRVIAEIERHEETT